jgi:hypothetical protein
MIAKLRSAEAWLTPFVALKFEIESLFTARCVAIKRIAKTQLMRVSAVAPRLKTAPDAMPSSIQAVTRPISVLPAASVVGKVPSACAK